ncbi:NDR1/HIN1-like protein 26 [Triticum dicoccoides]|uniref:NDR1/HIN1-like protein 26 n=1 Tax=Triticum dicoccoides TaxID=85692 RepID=UPI000E7ACA04|nr:NDR1/HIN1-like protein 26 [Triticum dicoccoides]
MSLITDDPDRSPRDCVAARRHHSDRRRRRLLIVAASAVALLLAMAIILWLTLLPSSPRFRLLSATASTNATGGMGTVLLDAALVAHNPNAHALALYDGLRARASYAGLQLAAAAPIPPFQQAQGDIVLSAALSSSSAAEETTAGGRSPTLLTLRLEGRLRWKVAVWVSGSRTLAAECVAAAISPSQPRAVVVQDCQCATTIG